MQILDPSLALVARLEAARDALTRDLAALDRETLDQAQVECFNLAWASASLRAAREGLCADAGLDRDLAQLYLRNQARVIMGWIEDARMSLSAVGPNAEGPNGEGSNGEGSNGEEANIEGAGPAGEATAESLQDCADWRALCAWADNAQVQSLGRAVIAAEGEVGQPQLNEGARMARDSFARLAREVVAPLAEEIHREDLTIPEAILGPMREMGAFGLAIPQEYGGFAEGAEGASEGGDGGGSGDSTTMIAVTEVLSQASLAAAGSLITRPEILSRALLKGGTEAQKQHFLPRIAAGDPLCAIAITEPDFGSDVASLALKARKTEGGWLLNGTKTWCTFAGKAELLMVVARSDPDPSIGHRGLSLMLVEKPSDEGHAFTHHQHAKNGEAQGANAGGLPGGTEGESQGETRGQTEGDSQGESQVETEGGETAQYAGTLSGKAIPTLGYRGMHSFEMAFENWFVADQNVVGEEGGLGQGFYLCMAGMTGGRMQTSARACGVMLAALKSAISYTQQRVVFGQRLADYPLSLAKLAHMAAQITVCRSLAYAVAGEGDNNARALSASIAKLIACRAAEEVSREALQLHGAMGYAEESAVSRYFVDARVLSIFEGAEETLALKVIARGIVDGAR